MIHPIAPPPLPGFGPASWWDWLFANTLLYWLVIIGVAVCLGYVAWVVYAALRARNAEASASFVSLACADRVARSHSTGGVRYFLVYTGPGLPDVQQFEHVLPSDESSFRITYRNELHVYLGGAHRLRAEHGTDRPAGRRAQGDFLGRGQFALHRDRPALGNAAVRDRAIFGRSAGTGRAHRQLNADGGMAQCPSRPAALLIVDAPGSHHA